MKVAAEDLFALIKAIEASPGHRLATRLLSLRVAGRVLSMNAQQLQEDLAQLDQFPFAFRLLSPPNRELSDEYHYEMARHLHNWLASTKTLVDHVRRYATSAASGSFTARYKDKVEQVFSANGQVAFVHDLRNLALHWAIPFIESELSERGDGSGPTCRARLRRTDLEAWGGWSRLGRTHLQGLPKSIELRGIVSGYQGRTVGSYEWLSSELDRRSLSEPALAAFQMGPDLFTIDGPGCRGIPEQAELAGQSGGERDGADLGSDA